MKRTNIVLDEQILEQATRTLGFKTYSATINFALKEAVRTHQVRSLRQFFGSNLWEGDLAEMREDHPETKREHLLPKE
jgi:Arc/MetJ family transcription regulator